MTDHITDKDRPYLSDVSFHYGHPPEGYGVTYTDMTATQDDLWRAINEELREAKRNYFKSFTRDYDSINKESSVKFEYVSYKGMSKKALKERLNEVESTLSDTQRALEKQDRKVLDLNSRIDSSTQVIEQQRTDNTRLIQASRELTVAVAKRDGWNWWIEEDDLLIYDGDGTLVTCMDGSILNADGITRVVAATFEKAQVCHG